MAKRSPGARSRDQAAALARASSRAARRPPGAASARRAAPRRAPADAAARAWGCRAPRARPRTAARRARRPATPTPCPRRSRHPRSSCARRSPSASRETHTISPRRTFMPTTSQRVVERAASAQATARSVVPFVARRHGPPRRPPLPRARTLRPDRRRSPAPASARPGACASIAAAPWRAAGPCRSCARARSRAADRDQQRPPGAAARRSAALAHRNAPLIVRPLSAGVTLAAAGIEPERAQRRRAAACPLSTAPSSVAGQPVSVQAPASTSPDSGGLRGRGAARRPRRGAKCGGVLAGHQEALDAAPRARAGTARPAPAGSARAERPRSSASPARRPTATPPDTGTPAGAAARRCDRTRTAPAFPRRPRTTRRHAGHRRRAGSRSASCPGRSSAAAPHPQPAARAAPRRAGAAPPRSRRLGAQALLRARGRHLKARSGALEPLGPPAEPHLDPGPASARAAGSPIVSLSGRSESRCRPRRRARAVPS